MFQSKGGCGFGLRFGLVLFSRKCLKLLSASIYPYLWKVYAEIILIFDSFSVFMKIRTTIVYLIYSLQTISTEKTWQEGAASLAPKTSISAAFQFQHIEIFLPVILKKDVKLLIFQLSLYASLLEKCMTILCLDRSFWKSQRSIISHVKMSYTTFRQIYSFQNPMILNRF